MECFLKTSQAGLSFCESNWEDEMISGGFVALMTGAPRAVCFRVAMASSSFPVFVLRALAAAAAARRSSSCPSYGLLLLASIAPLG